MSEPRRSLRLDIAETILKYKPWGPLLLALWTSGALGSLIVGIVKRYKEIPQQQRKSRDTRIEEMSFSAKLKILFHLGFPRLASESTYHLVLYTALLCTRILVTIQIAKLMGQLGKLIGSRNFKEMFRHQVIFGLWCFPAAFVNSLLHMERHNLSLAIRSNLIKYLHEQYLSKLLYYRISNLSPASSTTLPDVDQRITHDLNQFCKEIVILYGNLLKPGLEVIFISRTLANIMGTKNLMWFFTYFLFSGVWLRFLMPAFSKYTAQIQSLEGRFIQNHNRITTKAEEIAFYTGEKREKAILDENFAQIKKVTKRNYAMQCLMSIIDSYVVKYGAAMMAYSMLIPAVYYGQQGLAGKPTSEVMQYYLTSTQLFVSLGTACKLLVLSGKKIQSAKGLINRVFELVDVLNKRSKSEWKQDPVEADIISKAQAQLQKAKEEERDEEEDEDSAKMWSKPEFVEGETIHFENVSIFSPTANLLARDLNFSVEPGKCVLISGPNGSGKSSLFRVLAGLWPACTGRITRPEAGKLFYIPQQPYLVPGSLRDQITYPDHTPTDEKDELLTELMAEVGLGKIIERENGFDTEKDWGDVLSGGEKQRIAMARLFYHSPKFGILDECTSAVSAEIEGRIYESCKKRGITIFTVSHRKQLNKHHDYELHLVGKDGKWEWTNLDQ